MIPNSIEKTKAPPLNLESLEMLYSDSERPLEGDGDFKTQALRGLISRLYCALRQSLEKEERHG